MPFVFLRGGRLGRNASTNRLALSPGPSFVAHARRRQIGAPVARLAGVPSLRRPPEEVECQLTRFILEIPYFTVFLDRATNLGYFVTQPFLSCCLVDFVVLTFRLLIGQTGVT